MRSALVPFAVFNSIVPLCWPDREIDRIRAKFNTPRVWHFLVTVTVWARRLVCVHSMPRVPIPSNWSITLTMVGFALMRRCPITTGIWSKDQTSRQLILPFVCLTLILLVFATPAAIAVEPGEQLRNPALEARARQISTGLRCLVCQNETIDESNASLAHDIRVLLRERLTAGDTDEQAVKAIVDRYGEFVLLDPPVRPATYVLWFGPVAILLGALFGGMLWLRRRALVTETVVPLSPDERDRLDTIMREADR